MQAKEAAQGGFAHGLYVAKAHVVSDKGDNLVGVFVAEAEAVEQDAGHGCADLGMAVEADAGFFVAGLRRTVAGRLADIVQERGPGKRRLYAGFKLVEQEECVDPDIPLGVPLGRLLDTLHAGNFRQHLLQQAAFVKQFKGAFRMTFGQHPGELFANALAADLVDGFGLLLDGVQGLRLKGKAKTRGEAHRAQHAELVLLKAAVRRADGADRAGGEVGLATDEVEHVGLQVFRCKVDGVEHHAVDGEVAACGVALGRVGVGDRGGPTAVLVGAVVAKGGDLGFDLAAIGRELAADDDNAKMRANAEGSWEAEQHLLWRCGGGHIVVLGGKAEEEIAHAAAGKVGLVALPAQGLNNVQSGEKGWVVRDGGRFLLHGHWMRLGARGRGGLRLVLWQKV